MLLQFGTVGLLLASIIVPIMELCDQWDAPGPDNDVETGFLALLVIFCLILLVCILIAQFAKSIWLALFVDRLTFTRHRRWLEAFENAPIVSIFPIPLRI